MLVTTEDRISPTRHPQTKTGATTKGNNHDEPADDGSGPAFPARRHRPFARPLRALPDRVERHQAHAQQVKGRVNQTYPQAGPCSGMHRSRAPLLISRTSVHGTHAGTEQEEAGGHPSAIRMPTGLIGSLRCVGVQPSRRSALDGDGVLLLDLLPGLRLRQLQAQRAVLVAGVDVGILDVLAHVEAARAGADVR